MLAGGLVAIMQCTSRVMQLGFFSRGQDSACGLAMQNCKQAKSGGGRMSERTSMHMEDEACFKEIREVIVGALISALDSC